MPAMKPELLDFGDNFAAYTTAEIEARFIYKEIFTDHCYDIADFPENPFFVDAGANIGMFSMYMKRKFPHTKILAFEPAPSNYGILQQNLAYHSLDGVEAHQCALGAEEATEPLTFFHLMPGNSTFVPEEKEEMLKIIEGQFPPEFIHSLYNSREQIDVPVKRLSDFLPASHEMGNIDLLKIDVEAREIDVMRGLDDKHWAKVQNVAVEVFDIGGALASVIDFLKSKDFTNVRAEIALAGQDDPDKPKVYQVRCHRIYTGKYSIIQAQ
ncbi:hypothetical protein NW762_013206 [Fusarium torreyae]|uniref:Methyltransferase FkbM domain-containing protein n=1 Tax=Fusarium torreyae TaxID=1237075 RepID=A0A9W8VAP7_9HYPO|nr:hypothetical protein NW762_013206 [Fusarium torreyae]